MNSGGAIFRCCQPSAARIPCGMQAPSNIKPGYSLHPRVRIFAGGDMILGSGKIVLLQNVRDTGSIAEAARSMDISYNHAWSLIRLMNASFKKPLVEASRGGKGKGGAQITPAGEEVLRLYQEMVDECLKATKKPWQTLRRMLNPVESLPSHPPDKSES